MVESFKRQTTMSINVKTTDKASLTDQSVTNSPTNPESLCQEKSEQSTFKKLNCFGVNIVSTVIGVIAVLSLLVSIGGIIKLKMRNKALEVFEVKVEKQLEDSQKNLTSLQKTLQSVETKQKNQNKQLKAYHSLLTLQENQSVSALWQLQKTYAWLQQASLDLSAHEGVASALLLLKASNNMLQQLNLKELQPVATLIAQDMQILSAIQPINEIGILSQINAISDKVALLPNPVTPSNEPVTKNPNENVTQKHSWQLKLSHFWQTVKGVVVIHPSSDGTLLLPASSSLLSRQQLNENIQFILQQTQWALLKRDKALFDWSLSQAIDTLQANGKLIDLNSVITIEFLQNLQALKAQDLAPQLPDLQPVCDKFKAYLDILSVESAHADSEKVI